MGRYWAKIAQISDFAGKLQLGFIMRILRDEGVAVRGMRSRAPPVADAARRSIRSGRKNRASEQREDFFGHRKAARTAIGQGVRRRKSRCRDRNLNKQLFAQTAPPPLRGRGTGRGQMRPRLPWARICAQYGRCVSIVRIPHCKRQKGVRQGGSCPP